MSKTQVSSTAKLAKLKNVAETITRDSGEFTLVSVIEGEDQVSRLTGLVQEAVCLKNTIIQLKAKYTTLTEASPAEKELVATDINDSRKKFDELMPHLAKTYNYSMAFNYVIVPYQSRYSEGGKDIVCETEEHHQEVEELRAEIVKLVQNKDDAGAKTVREQLMKDYKFDIQKNYTLHIKKAGLYAQRAV